LPHEIHAAVHDHASLFTPFIVNTPLTLHYLAIVTPMKQSVPQSKGLAYPCDTASRSPNC